MPRSSSSRASISACAARRGCTCATRKDARSSRASPPASWDAIVIDAFVAATVPRRLITVQALADVARVAPLALINVIDTRSGEEVRIVAAALADAYPTVWTLGARFGNVVLAGGVSPPNLDRIAVPAAADPSPPRITTSETIARRTAGAVPLRDEEIDEPRQVPALA